MVNRHIFIEFSLSTIQMVLIFKTIAQYSRLYFVLIQICSIALPPFIAC